MTFPEQPPAAPSILRDQALLLPCESAYLTDNGRMPILVGVFAQYTSAAISPGHQRLPIPPFRLYLRVQQAPRAQAPWGIAIIVRLVEVNGRVCDLAHVAYGCEGITSQGTANAAENILTMPPILIDLPLEIPVFVASQSNTAMVRYEAWSGNDLSAWCAVRHTINLETQP